MVWMFQIVTIWTCHHLKKISFTYQNNWCHRLNMSPSEKNIHFHINMNMSPYGMSPYEEYSYLSPFWYEIFRWWQIWILHTKPPYGDIVTVWRLGMKIFHTCHQKNRSDGDGLIGFTIELPGDQTNWGTNLPGIRQIGVQTSQVIWQIGVQTPQWSDKLEYKPPRWSDKLEYNPPPRWCNKLEYKPPGDQTNCHQTSQWSDKLEYKLKQSIKETLFRAKNIGIVTKPPTKRSHPTEFIPAQPRLVQATIKSIKSKSSEAIQVVIR